MVLLIFILLPSLAIGTDMSVLPAFQIVTNNGAVGIYLLPTEPIKAWELKIVFNPEYIQVNNVAEGDFFKGYLTFFSPNVKIDNVNGTITNLYDLIMGLGNVTTDGCLINITFTAIDSPSISSIEIQDAGITNETKYLPLTTYDGRILTQGIDMNADAELPQYTPPSSGIPLIPSLPLSIPVQQTDSESSMTVPYLLLIAFVVVCILHIILIGKQQ